MESNNYYKQEYTITAMKGNLMAGSLAIPIIFLFGIPYFLIWGNLLHEITDFITGWILHIVIILFIFMVGVFLHEFIHGITWAVFTKNGMKSVKFGIMASSLTPYCHCKEILKSIQYKAGAIIPAIITGFFPSILSIIIGNPIFLVFGILFTIAAAGDLMMFWMLRKEKNTLIEDHPSKIGYIVYREN